MKKVAVYVRDHNSFWIHQGTNKEEETGVPISEAITLVKLLCEKGLTVKIEPKK